MGILISFLNLLLYLAIILFVAVFGAANIYVKVLNKVKQR